MWEENLGTQASVCLIEGVCLIQGQLNTGFTVYHEMMTLDKIFNVKSLGKLSRYVTM